MDPVAEPGLASKESIDDPGQSSRVKAVPESSMAVMSDIDESLDEESEGTPPVLLNPNTVVGPLAANPAAGIKSTILKTWVANKNPPSLLRVPELESEGVSSASVSLAAPLNQVLSVDTTLTPSENRAPKSSTHSSSDFCGACDRRCRVWEQFPCRRETVYEDPSGEEIPWVQCDVCKAWFHIYCVDLEDYEVHLIEQYHCALCQPLRGPSIPKKMILDHRRNAENIEERDKPTEIGTKRFCEEFARTEAERFPPPPESLVSVIESGVEFESCFDRHATWTKVFLIKEKRGLGIQIPEHGEFDIDKCVDLVDPNHSVQTIDVYRQQSNKMKIGTFRDKFKSMDRPRLYNILSLEFSDMKLAAYVQPPSIVRELSWAARYWPRHGMTVDEDDRVDPSHLLARPDVELFALIGMGGSFTNFHIDFGGSSVWYHVYEGQKIFYIIEPTLANIAAFHAHQQADDQLERFFADEVDACYRVVISPGETLMIPAGWIHAVYTPVDSYVFGGNFLHFLNIATQLNVYEKEYAQKLEDQYLYPNFELINWYAARTMADMLREAKEDGEMGEHMLQGARALRRALSKWNQRDLVAVGAAHKPFIYGDSQMVILSRLNKELSAYERLHGLPRQEWEGEQRKRDLNLFLEKSEDSASGMRIGIDLRIPTLSDPLGERRRVETVAAAVGQEGGEMVEEKGEKEVETEEKTVTKKERKPIPRLKISRRDTAESPSSPMTPRVTIRIGDEMRRVDGEIDMVKMFGTRSSSGRKHKPAAWLRETVGEELEKEMEESDLREDVLPRAQKRQQLKQDPDYDALDEAEKKEEERNSPIKKRKRAMPPKKEKAPEKEKVSPAEKATPSAAKAAVKKPTASVKQRLALSLKKLKKI